MKALYVLDETAAQSPKVAGNPQNVDLPEVFRPYKLQHQLLCQGCPDMA